MKKFLWIALACLVVFLGCNLLNRDFYRATDEYFGDPTKGAVDVVVNGGSIATKTLTPNMDVANYRLRFINSFLTPAEDFTVTIAAGPTGILTHTQGGLTPSIDPNWWQVRVTALNNESSPQVIGAIGGVETNAEVFEITAGSKSTVNISVVPIYVDDYGDLTIFVSWPDAAGAEEDLVGTLSGAALTFTVDDQVEPIVATYTGSWLTDYYTLILQLWDGDSLLWGYMEAVRIVDNLPTDTGVTDFALTLTVGGSVSLPITPNMNNPVKIELDSDGTPGGTITLPPGILYQGQSVTVTAVLDPPDPLLTPPAAGAYTYQWYRDGAPITGESIGELTEAITITAAGEDVGVHNYSILVTVLEDPGVTPETLSSENFKMDISSSTPP